MMKIINDFLTVFSSPVRRLEYRRRIKIANEYITWLSKGGVKIKSWRIKGSTMRQDFGFSSDVDIDILVEHESDVNEAYRLHRIIGFIFKGLLFDIFITSEEFIRSIPDEQLRNFALKSFGVKHNARSS